MSTLDEMKVKIKLTDSDDRRKSQSTLLIEIGEKANLFHDSNNDAYAEFTLNDIKTTMAIDSREYREYLSHELYKLTGKGANATAITDAKNTLEAKAKFSGKELKVAIRVFWADGADGADRSVFIDKGCKDRKIIKINADGVSYTDDCPVKFVRKRGMTELPDLSDHGDLSLLGCHLNVTQEELPLVYGWMLCAMAGVKPFPILVLQGEQGTGKSSVSKQVRALTDPSSVSLRSPPKDTRDLLVSAANNHLVVLDNLSGLRPEISDCLCRLSTGGGIDIRSLFTNGEQFLLDIQKPVLINGIDDIATRPDLAERAIILTLPVIEPSNRLSENELRCLFEQDKSKIFSGLLRGISSGLEHVNNVVLTEKPRMADAALWVTACERNLGMEGQFIKAHTQNQLHAVELGIESSPIGSAITELMAQRERWFGTPTELLNQLEEIAGERQARSRAWPQSPKGLNNAVRRLMPSFRKIGIKISKQVNHGREYEIENIGFYPPQVPQVPRPTDDKGCSVGGYKTHPHIGAVKRPSGADSISKRPSCTPDISTHGADGADGALKNQTILKHDEGGEIL